VPLGGQQVVQQFVEDVAALREAGIVIVLPADKDLTGVHTLIQAPVLSLWGAEFSAVGQAYHVLRCEGPSPRTCEV